MIQSRTELCRIRSDCYRSCFLFSVSDFRKTTACLKDQAARSIQQVAYSELIKNFSHVRAYLRSFYVYGFQHRSEYTQKSSRMYDNERRRVESWLGKYLTFIQDKEGRRVFISLDSRDIPQNPLFSAFRAKSFTPTDISLHFHVLDILQTENSLSITDLMNSLTARLLDFNGEILPDESTVRRKLKEYVALGLLCTGKKGRETVYSLPDSYSDLEKWNCAAAFFSEVLPMGVIGSYIQDRMAERCQFFRFRQHYILSTLDSEILYSAAQAINEKRLITYSHNNQNLKVLPQKIYIGTQTGRQYLLVWSPKRRKFSFQRTDQISNLKIDEAFDVPQDLEEKLKIYQSHAWGVTSCNNQSCTEHIEMILSIRAGEDYLLNKLINEKRCGTVEQIDETRWLFRADVYNTLEMVPWLRSFTGSILELKGSNSVVIKRFWKDLSDLANLYCSGDTGKSGEADE